MWWARADSHEKMQAGVLACVVVFYGVLSLTAVSAELHRWVAR